MRLPPWALSAEVRHNLFLAFKEALHNIVKHARATEVRISLELSARSFALMIVDNGCGFDWSNVGARLPAAADASRAAAGNGLLNMRKRLEEVGGHCEWVAAPAEGTRVKLTISVDSM
jgi:signal transduction histidine kinase